jgi:hypothetical protein
MSLSVGPIVKVSGTATTNVLSGSASGGTAPYAYIWYRSTISGFTPGAGNTIAGQVTSTLNDSGLTPGTVYYYEYTVNDAASATLNSSQAAEPTSAATLDPNQFGMVEMPGVLDLRYNYNTISVQFDPASTGTLSPGQAVVCTTTPGGVPKVAPSTLASDIVWGFVNYNNKNATFGPGDYLEVSQSGNVIYLYAALAINRGQRVTSLTAGVVGGCVAGVIPAITSGGIPIVGEAMDTASIGQLLRIKVSTPAYTLS